MVFRNSNVPNDPPRLSLVCAWRLRCSYSTMPPFGKKGSSSVTICIPEARFTLGMVHLHKVYVELVANGQRFASRPVVPGPADPVSHRFKCQYQDVSVVVPLLPWDGQPVISLSVWDRSKRRKTCLGSVDVSVDDIFLDSSDKTFSIPSTLFPTLNTKIDVSFKLEIDAEDLATWRALYANTEGLSDSESLLSTLSELSDASASSDGGNNLEVPPIDEKGSSRASLRSRLSRKSRGSASPSPRIPRRYRKQKHEFSMDVDSDLIGIAYLDIVGARNLPRFRTLTGLSFDMDPFVVISCGKKVFKTQYKRHTLNPTFNQRVLLMVDRHELNYTIKFTVWDKDRVTLNDRVGEGSLSIQEILSNAPKEVDGIYWLEDYQSTSKVVPLEVYDDSKGKGSSKPELLVNFHFLPFPAVRQQMWRGVISMYENEQQRLNREAVMTMLQSIGSNITNGGIDDLFEGQEELSGDSLVVHLEQLDGVKRISFRVCPVCQSPQPKTKQVDSLRHISFCASRQWNGDAVLLDNSYVTSAQASRKWYTRFLSKFSYGKYQLGANNANILVQDRISGQISEEKMSTYVRIGMRVLYATGPLETRKMQRMLKKYTLKQGIKYDSPESSSSIEPFIKFHSLDMSDVKCPISAFKTFNQFFYRELKSGARPCENPEEPRTAVSLADCRLTAFETVEQAQEFWIKGKTFSVKTLLGPNFDSEAYTGGSLVIFRLAPQDYHRFHIPVDGILGEPHHIPGEYYTVNPMAIRSALDVYGQNVRTVVALDSPQFGRVMIVLVGAMMVGSIEVTAKPGPVKRTDELGYFKFGGSTVVLLFEPGRIVLDHDLVNNSKMAVETLVRVGMSIGHAPGVPEYRRVYDTRNTTLQRAETTIVGGGSYMPFSLD